MNFRLLATVCTGVVVLRIGRQEPRPVRMVRARVAGVAVLTALIAILLGGCELREGVSSEYGGIGRQQIG